MKIDDDRVEEMAKAYEEKRALLRQRAEIESRLKDLRAAQVAKRLEVSASKVYRVWEQCRESMV
jgi:transposase